MGCNSLFVFGRSTSGSTALLHVGGLVALLGVRFVADFLISRPLSMAARRLRGLLISVVLNLIINTFGPLFLLYLFCFTSLSIRWRGITPSWPRAVLRGLLAQGLLHDP
jgi:hypothetical protein